MNIVEMFQVIGPENTLLQRLDESLTNCQRRKSGDCLVTFATNQINPNNVVSDTGKVGLVIWIEREAWNRLTKKTQP